MVIDMENKIFKRDAEVIVTPQAQMVLNETKYDIEEFVEWAMKVNKISFGGHNVVMFIEYKNRG